MEEGIDPVVVLAEDLGVVGVGGDALEAVGEELLQAGDVVAEPAPACLDRGGSALRDEPVERRRRAARRRGRRAPARRRRLACAGRLVERLRPVAHGRGALDQAAQALGVEVDVGDGGEERFDDEDVDLAVARAEGGGAMRVHGDALGGVDEQVLQGRGGSVLAADAGGGTTGALGGLLALITEHVHYAASMNTRP